MLSLMAAEQFSELFRSNIKQPIEILKSNFRAQFLS